MPGQDRMESHKQVVTLGHQFKKQAAEALVEWLVFPVLLFWIA